MEISNNKSFSLPSSTKAFYLRSALDSFAVITLIAVGYMVLLKVFPVTFYLFLPIGILSLFLIIRRTYFNRRVTFSDAGITLRRRAQKKIMTEHFLWEQVHSIRYVHKDRDFGRIDIKLKNSDVIELNLDDYFSIDFTNYKGKYDSDVVSNLTEICNRNGKRFLLR